MLWYIVDSVYITQANSKSNEGIIDWISDSMFKYISDIRLWYPKMMMKLFMEKVLNQYKKLEVEREIQTNSSYLICLDSKISSLILLLRKIISPLYARRFNYNTGV